MAGMMKLRRSYIPDFGYRFTKQDLMFLISAKRYYFPALLISQVMAIVWFAVALRLADSRLILVWSDQARIFMQGLSHLTAPYQVSGFANPPWALLLLAPFNVLPLPVAVLSQLCLYFATLTTIIYKFNGNVWSVLIALTSVISLDTAIELNIDWLVCVGLLVPPVISGPLLLIKPQTALGYWLSLPIRQVVKAIVIALAVSLISLLLWKDWPLQMWQAIQADILGRFFNLAPQKFLSPVLSFAIGCGLSWLAYRKRDPVIGILAWIFFVPYIAFYSFLLHLSLVAARWRWLALAISLGLWLVLFVYGQHLIKAFLG